MRILFFIGTIVLISVENKNKASQVGLISYYMVLSFWVAQTLAMSLLSRNMAGQTQKNRHCRHELHCMGNGKFHRAPGLPYPRYFVAFATQMGCYVLLVLDIAFLRFNLMSRNKVKDKLAEQVSEARDEGLVHAFDDLTHRENLNFRYMF